MQICYKLYVVYETLRYVQKKKKIKHTFKQCYAKMYSSY